MPKTLPKMIDMAMTPSERAKGMMSPASYADSPGQPVYPYGLSISLGDEEIKKLNVQGDIESGDMMALSILCKVTCVSDTDTTDGKRRRVELQITHIADEEEEEEEVVKKQPMKTLYKR